MMDLSPEDALRVNVLLASPLQAVRIDESKMILHALSDKGEATIRLNPNCSDDAYLRRLREALSSHVLGSPGGYPVYLKRWTRMGQTRDGLLESLLLLGEPEAVVAVVNAAGITNEIARRAWWAAQNADSARCMLAQQSVVNGDMGPVLADFLVEFLPFEEEAVDQIRSVRLVLQGNLVDAGVRQQLWDRGRQKNTYYVGFLQALPDRLPGDYRASPCFETVAEAARPLAAAGNAYATQLLRLLDAPGQGFLAVVSQVMKKPSNQDVMVELMHALAAHSGRLPSPAGRLHDIGDIARCADALAADAAGLEGPARAALSALLAACPRNRAQIRAMLFLAQLGEQVLNPVFSRTDAIGTVMRRKLQPVTGPVREQIDVLMKS